MGVRQAGLRPEEDIEAMVGVSVDKPGHSLGQYRVEAGRIADRARLQQLLESAAGPRALVLTHIPLVDLLRVPAHTPEAHRLRRQLSQFRVDGILATHDTYRVQLAVVLEQEPVERSAFTVAALRDAGLPAVSVRVVDLETPNRLAERFAAYMPGPAEHTVEVPVVPAAVATPTCPTCGAPMVLRRKLHGLDHGHRFWGCSTYVQTGCRGLRPAWVAVLRPTS